jgi:ABC-type uncharacterized transport system auxiliary subunit
MRFAPPVTAILLVLGGCASAPKIDYYTLGMEASDRAQTKVNLEVERFRATEALNRSQIMILATPTRIEYYATDHWAGSLGELVQQKLAAEFGPPVDGRKTLVVTGRVLACEQVDIPGGGAEARVRLEVLVRDSEVPRYQQPLFVKTYISSRPVSSPGAGNTVEALARCLEDIAAEIAADSASVE